MLKVFDLVKFNNKKILSKVILGGLTLLAHDVYAMEGDAENQRNTYVLKTGAAGAKRLDHQHDFLSKYSKLHLARAKLSEGQTIFDIGCGTGAMTVELALKVGKTGRVYALDKNKDQLDLARKKAEENGLTNITFIEGDIRTVQNLPLGADLVYIRYLLMHVPDPQNVINVAQGLLKPGGRLAFHEPIMSSSHYPEEHTVFREFADTIHTMGTKMGVNYDIGANLEKLCNQAGCVNVSVENSRPEVDMQTIKLVLLRGFNEWKNLAIGANMITQDQANNWVNTIENWPEGVTDGFYKMPEQTYLIAEKP